MFYPTQPTWFRWLMFVVIFTVFSFIFDERASATESTPLKVLLKLDDAVAVDGRWPERWQRVDDFCAKRAIPYSIGVICNSLQGNNPEYIAALRAIVDDGRAELWLHGYDHRRWKVNGVQVSEFKGSGYAHQFDALQKSCKLAQEKLGVKFSTFGAPFNATDDDTINALEQFPDIKVWLFAPRGVKSSKFTTPQINAVNLEHPVHHPSFEQFKIGYEQHKHDPYLVMQGHPMSWDDEAFAEFVCIVDFLQAEGVRFVFPRELPNR